MKTKTHFYFYMVLAILIGGCKNNPATNDAEINKVSKQRDSLMELSIRKDSAINAFVSSFTEIENNLVSIKQKENLLSVHSKKNAELSGSIKDEVNENIKIINDLMDKNRQKITSLNSKLKEANFTIGQLAGLVDILITNINYKNQDLILLSDVLMANGKTTVKLNTAMINFGMQSANKTDTINQKNTLLNTAYYIIGEIGELKEKKIVEERGGFFSPNQYEKVNPDFNRDYFTKIDIKQTTNIPISGKNAKFISTHPSDSYKLEKQNKNNSIANLIITNPIKFWSESKFLIVSVD